MLGGMQHWPLRIMRLLDHAEREHGAREGRVPLGGRQ
jgi:fatty-acyl-CoA synthase